MSQYSTMAFLKSVLVASCTVLVVGIPMSYVCSCLMCAHVLCVLMSLCRCSLTTTNHSSRSRTIKLYIDGHSYNYIVLTIVSFHKQLLLNFIYFIHTVDCGIILCCLQVHNKNL